jgi:hypothetical protein
MLTVTGVCERDVDLLLMEELWSSTKFAEWFLGHARPVAHGMAITSIRRSATEFSGESDLEVEWADSNGVHQLLVENKVDAAFQHNQARRYQERARAHAARYASVTTMLVAPSAYFGRDRSAMGFDVRLTYESMREWYLASRLGKRAEYKAALLTMAIEKTRRGYQAVADDAVTSFWHRYYELVNREAPQLQMPEPRGAKPAGSYFIYLLPSSLPKGVYLVHKLASAKADTGFVDLQMDGCGERIAKITAALGSHLSAGMVIRRAGKSCVIRKAVPRIRMAERFEAQESAVREGIASAVALLEWATRMRGEIVQLLRQHN